MSITRKSRVIKVSPLILLFLIQFLLIFLGLTIFLLVQYRKLSVKEIISRGEANRLRAELENQEKQNIELSGWKDMFGALQTKFEQVKNINAKLKESINALIPEAKRTKEHEKVIGEIEQFYAEIDSFVESLREEKERLHQQSKSYKSEIDRLSQKLEHSVSKGEYDNLKAQKKSLELKLDKLKNDLMDKNKEYVNLQKNYIWLEKEYNALYKNINTGNS